MSKWYTTLDVAEELGVTVRTVERWRSEGKFKPKRRTIGGHSRYSKEQVEEKIMETMSLDEMLE
jgi:excisionase family DNA binding protein